MATTPKVLFTELFEPSTLGKDEADFVESLGSLLDAFEGTIKFPITENEEEKKFFAACAGLKENKIFMNYKLTEKIDLKRSHE